MSLSLGTIPTQALLVAAASVAQVGILVGMIVADGAPLVFGETLRLKVIPVDPRDLFRGDYVVLGYDYSRVDRNRIPGLNSDYDWRQRDEGRDVFITLQPSSDEKYWSAAEYDLHRPTGQHYLQGTLRSWGQIECGIEAWYVQEGEGRRIENAIRAGRNVYADVAVWHGAARLKQLIVE